MSVWGVLVIEDVSAGCLPLLLFPLLSSTLMGPGSLLDHQILLSFWQNLCQIEANVPFVGRLWRCCHHYTIHVRNKENDRSTII